MTTNKKKIAGWIAAPLALTLALAGCTAIDGATGAVGASEETSAAAVVQTTSTGSAQEILDENQTPHDEDDAANTAAETAIALTGDSVTLTGGGTYRLSGNIADGAVTVNTEDAITLILDGVNIANSSGAAIEILSADETVIVVEGSDNALSDTSAYDEGADANAALFSAADLTVTGTGTLRITGNGNDALASKDGLVIDGPTLIVDAVDDGIRGKDYVVIRSGQLTVTAGGDGIKADNDTDADRGYIALLGGDVTVTADGDGLAAATDIVTTAGTLTVAAGGGHGTTASEETSTKGVKAGVIIAIDGGDVSADAADDALHSDGDLLVAAGTVTVASGDDGLHAEVGIRITGGAIDVTSSYEGIEALTIHVSGGVVNVVSSDDGLNAANGTGNGAPGVVTPGALIEISGGDLTIDAGGDGIDSNGDIVISGGVITFVGAAGRGDSAVDYDGSYTNTGGELNLPEGEEIGGAPGDGFGGGQRPEPGTTPGAQLP